MKELALPLLMICLFFARTASADHYNPNTGCGCKCETMTNHRWWPARKVIGALQKCGCGFVTHNEFWMHPYGGHKNLKAAHAACEASCAAYVAEEN